MIKFLVMDVDGTLTDGKIYMGENGELFKAFSIKDGCGIKDILPQYGIEPVIITARNSGILSHRCRELGVVHLYQGVRQKTERLVQLLSDYNAEHHTDYTLGSCAYIGDDILDIPCMEAVKAAGGAVGAPQDAVENVIRIADYVCQKEGGKGAVREFIEWIIKNIQETVGGSV